MWRITILPFARDGGFGDAADGQDRGFGRVDDRRREDGAEKAGVRDGEGAAADFVGGEFAGARVIGDFGQPLGQLAHAQVVRIPDDRHDQAAFDGDRDAEMDAPVEDELLAAPRSVDRRQLLSARPRSPS